MNEYKDHWERFCAATRQHFFASEALCCCAADLASDDHASGCGAVLPHTPSAS